MQLQILKIEMPICKCDHLIDMLRNNLSDNKDNNDAKLHPSKCTNIIKKVLCTHCEDLKRDIGGNRYSFSLDESIDIF